MKVATLAVGTEVTDGQIVDRNSAILSQLSVHLGFEMIEHRAVPDDRDLILSALKELGSKVKLLFVTGGLGPTSDDFTRELIAKYVGTDLVFDEGSWQHVVKTLESRGVVAREIQKQQCYFPKSAVIYQNPVGTANAFSIKRGELQIFALPGPPSEVKAVWQSSLSAEFEKLVPPEKREKLEIWRCIGKGESDIAELVEPIVKDSGLRVGYRAHAPYVEVKVWSLERSSAAETCAKIDQVLAAYLVNKNDEDLARDFLNLSTRIRVFDSATSGLLSERIWSFVREEKVNTDLQITTFPTGVLTSDAIVSNGENSQTLSFYLLANSAAQAWQLTLQQGRHPAKTIEVKAIYNRRIDSERSRKYICEKALQVAVRELAKL